MRGMRPGDGVPHLGTLFTGTPRPCRPRLSTPKRVPLSERSRKKMPRYTQSELRIVAPTQSEPVF